MPSSWASAAIRSGLRDQLSSPSPTVTSKCLATFLRFSSRPSRRLIASRPRRRLPPAPHLGGDALQNALGGLQQGLPLARPLGPQARVQAHQQTLVGKVRAADLGHLVGHQLGGPQGGLHAVRILPGRRLGGA